MFGRVFSGILQVLPRITSTAHAPPSNFAPLVLRNQPWDFTSVRTRVRYHFPHAKERKRIKTHGFWARMATPGGRRVLMRRILRGKHVLSH